MDNGKQLMSALLSGTATGQIGLYENIWPDTIWAWIKDGYPCANGEPLPPEDVFGFDIGRIGAAFDASPFPGQRRVISETEDATIVLDELGVTKKIWRNKTAPAGPIAFTLNSMDVFEAQYLPAFTQIDPARVDAPAAAARLARHQNTGRYTCYNMSFVWENLRQTVGDMFMYESMIDDPGFIRAYNDAMLAFYKAHIELALESAPAPDAIWLSEDLAYNQGLFCSEGTLRDLIFPYYCALNAFLHEKGLKVILHSCGNITRALPLIVEAGFDALHPMQIQAGCDPLAIARDYRDSLLLMGGLNLHLFEGGDQQKLEDAQVRLMRGMQDIGARYVFCSDHSLSPNVRYDTYLRAMDTYHQHCGR